MRTTLNIDDTLLREAKGLAVRNGRSLGSVVEDALRIMLAEHADSRQRAMNFSLPTDGAGGLQPGVDLDNKEALANLLYDDDRYASATH